MNFPRFLLPSLPMWKIVESSKNLDSPPADDNGADDPVPSAANNPTTARNSFDSGLGHDFDGENDDGDNDALSHSGESEYYTTDDDFDEASDEAFADYDSSAESGEEDDDEEEEEIDARRFFEEEQRQQAAGSVAGASGSTPSSYPSNDGGIVGGGHSRRQSSGGSSSRRRGKRPVTNQTSLEDVDIRIGIKRSNTEKSQRSQKGAVKGFLSATISTLKCHRCQTDLCFTSSIISKGFTGRHGRAYLVSSLLPSNILHSKPTSRTLQTGPHTVSDISCLACGSNLGWKYLAAEDRSQRYKVGKYILETGKVIRCNSWEKHGGMLEDETSGFDRKGWELGWEEGVGRAFVDKDKGKTSDSELLEVDSEDEDELEELFSGTWDPDKVARRREKRKCKA